LLLELPKGGKTRTVDMTPGARTVIEGWLEISEQRGRRTEGNALVFPHPRTAGLLPAANLTKRLYSAMRKAGVPAEDEHGRKRNLHRLRHTFARIVLEKGSPIDWLSRQVGHSSIVLTVNSYGQWSREAERTQAKALEGAFNV
jgi:integrase